MTNQETLFAVSESIEKLFSSIESINKEKWKENKKSQVERKKGSLKVTG